MLLNFAFR